jgi:peptidoglycan-associated lipoprotein
MKKLFTLLTLALSVSLTSFAQKDLTKEAYDVFDAQEYTNAIAALKKAYGKEKDKAKKAEIIFKVAECYRLTNNWKQAEVWYRKAIKVKYADPIAYLRLGESLKVMEKYQDAAVEFESYKTKNPSDPRGGNGVESCTLAQKWKDNPTRYVVENVAQINGKNNDFAPAFSKKNYKELYFTSSRDDASGKEVDGWTGASFTDIFVAKLDKKGKWSTPSALPAPVNSVFNEGASSLSPNGNSFYFTRCGVEKKKAMGCELYKSTVNGQSFGDPELINLGLPDSILVTSGHPAVNADESKLYFASDMPGGQGGKDIWVLNWDKEKKRWGKPENLGASINTPGDEMFPFIHADGTFYFASNGHIGMGGLDIFKATKQGTSFGNVTNLRYPINSAGDDFAIIFEEKNEKGYFTSNRDGGKGNDDIYSFILPSLVFTLSGTVKDFKTKQPVSDALVTIVGTDGSSLETKTDGKGFYKFDLSPATSYVITAGKKADKNGYLNKTGKTTTVGFETDKALVHDFELDPIQGVIDLPNIYYDLGRWELRPESKVALDGLIQTLEENPTIVIELGAHTDTRGSDENNLTLSQKRAQSVVDYLIENGIDAERLVAKGYGESVPRRIEIATSFFKVGDVINDAFIGKYKKEDPKFEESHQMNRRTEFKVLRDNFVPKPKK